MQCVIKIRTGGNKELYLHFLGRFSVNFGLSEELP
jgi:hypothetical protein